MTKDEAKAIFKPRLVENLRSRVAWVNIVQSVQRAGPGVKDEIVRGVRERSGKRVGIALKDSIEEWLDAEAESQLDAILSDDSISLDELDDLV